VRCSGRSFELGSRSYLTLDGDEVLALARSREEQGFRLAAKGTPSALFMLRLCDPQIS